MKRKTRATPAGVARTCIGCHCLASAHHGPEVGCEGCGGHCNCMLTEDEVMKQTPMNEVTATAGEVVVLPQLEHTGYFVTMFVRWERNQFAEMTVEYVDGLEFIGEATEKARLWVERNPKHHRARIEKVRIVRIPAEEVKDGQ